MAERRLFAKTIIDSDAFLEMPMSARLLYYDLGMRADDDGFINSPNKIMRTIGATKDDMNILIARKFVIPFESGVVVIKAWRINNYLRSDRYNETKYIEEKALLDVDSRGMYHAKGGVGITCGIQTVSTDKDSIGKVSIGKDSIGNTICAEPNELATSQPPIITLILNDKSEYGITQKDIDEYTELYPGANVMQELRNMKGWCMSNPTRRKTRTGIKRFITNWLSKAQNQGGGNEKKGDWFK